MLRTTAMPVGLLISLAFVGARARPQAEVKAEKASEARGLLRPVEVRLDFRDRTLAEIVQRDQRPGAEDAGDRPGVE